MNPTTLQLNCPPYVQELYGNLSDGQGRQQVLPEAHLDIQN